MVVCSSGKTARCDDDCRVSAAPSGAASVFLPGCRSPCTRCGRPMCVRYRIFVPPRRRADSGMQHASTGTCRGRLHGARNLLGKCAVYSPGSRSPGNDLRLEHETAVLDLAAGQIFLREVAKASNFPFLQGTSGGGPLAALYCQQAGRAPEARIKKYPGGRPYQAQFREPAAAGRRGTFYALTHPGQGLEILMNSIDPAVIDEADPLKSDEEHLGLQSGKWLQGSADEFVLFAGLHAALSRSAARARRTHRRLRERMPRQEGRCPKAKEGWRQTGTRRSLRPIHQSSRCGGRTPIRGSSTFRSIRRIEPTGPVLGRGSGRVELRQCRFCAGLHARELAVQLVRPCRPTLRWDACAPDIHPAHLDDRIYWR